MIPDAKGFIFDLDGTLLYLPVDWAELRRKLKSIANVTYEIQPIFPTLLNIINKRPELKDRLFGTIDEFEARAAPKTTLQDGSMEVLELLKSCDKTLVTMQGRAVIDKLFDSLKLKKYFSASFTRESSLERSGQLELALAGMGLKTRDVIFVGDRINDLDAARRVGLRFILVRGRVDEVDPSVSYSSMSALLSALQSDEPVRVIR